MVDETCKTSDARVSFGDLIPIAEFRDAIAATAITDSDGIGHPVIGDICQCNIWVHPSKLSELPPEITHIMWFNK